MKSLSICADTVWAPVIDGDFVTDDPDVLLESGRVNQKDVMTGVNRDEGTFFISMFSYMSSAHSLKSPRQTICSVGNDQNQMN